MKKTLIALAAAAAFFAATVSPQPARADISAFWLVPAFVVGTWFGHAHAHGHPFPFWGPECWYEKRKIRGRYRTVRVCY